MTLLVPGVGPVIVSGLIGAVLLGAGGALVGATLEASLAMGLPRDELFVYEDALRRGHSVVVAQVDADDLAAGAPQMLAIAGAETIDAARERCSLRPTPRQLRWRRPPVEAGRRPAGADGAGGRRHS
jgi:hypothetical protein